MSEDDKSKTSAVGIAGLPRKWSVAVQLVGTFGLAVFLVLYYVLFMYPRETARYDDLRASVEGLMDVVKRQTTMIEGPQADRLENLFLSAVAGDFCLGAALATASDAKVEPTKLAIELDSVLMRQVDQLQGLTRADGKQISEMLTNKIRESHVSMKVAVEAPKRWEGKSNLDILRDCKFLLEGELGRFRRAK